MTQPPDPPAAPTFASLGLKESLLATIAGLGYEVPTPIQQRTIPILLAGRDIIGQAQTGTGKTAAFALPILERIDPSLRKTQALVLTPTRELAMQVAEAFHSYAHGMTELSVLPVYGGASIVHQLKRLERGVQIVVGTPGRLIDHLDRKSLKLDGIRMVVLDEADEMLKMGFIDDVERILASATGERQVALFSATMPPEVVRIAQKHLHDPVRIEIEHKSLTAPDIEQRFLNVSEGQKLEVLTHILELEENDATLIFRRTKTGAAELAERLEGRGFAAVAMHGDMKQNERESVIRRLKNGTIEIVVATDVAARGLDVEQISHVVNYDIPYDVEAYVHRVGRTGRAGRSGVATLFITPRERRMMREIEKYTGTPIKPMKMPSRADLAARRVGQLKDSIRKTMQEGDLEMYLQLVEQMVEEGPHDISEIAAAAARMASASRPIAAEAEETRIAPPPTMSEDAPRRREQQRPESGRPTPPWSAGRERPPREDDGTPKTRLVMAVGKADGIRPADVVGSIANEADVPGREIGPIDIQEEMTFVTIPTSYLDQVLEKVGRAKFRGRPVSLRVAKPNEGGGPRSRTMRDDRPPRREFNRDARPPREFNREGRPPAAERPFKPADRPAAGGDRPFKPASRPFKSGDRPFKPGARPARTGDRPPLRGDKPVRREGAPSRSEERPRGGAFSRFTKPTAGSKRPSGPPKGRKR